MREFYHYTSRYHLPVILYDGYLKLTESNLRQEEEMYKPVVWLTSAEVLSKMLDAHNVKVTSITPSTQSYYTNAATLEIEQLEG